MTQQERPGQLDTAPERLDATPTVVDTVKTDTAEALAGVPEAALLNVLRTLQAADLFTAPLEGHMRATLNQTVWDALARAAGDLGLTIVQPVEERGELLRPENTVQFVDKAAVALEIKGEILTVFVQHPGRAGFYPLTQRYTFKPN